MNRLSQRYWIVFFILLFTEIMWIPFISGLGVPLLYTALYLFLFGYFLPDPLEEYGIHFRKVPMQAVSGIILALFTILPILLMDLTVSWKWLPFFSQAFYIPIYILFLSLAVSGQHSVLRHTGGTGISGFFTNFFSEALQKFIFQRHSVCQYICCKPLPRRTKFRASPFCFYYGVHIWSFKNKETRKFYHFFALPCTHFT